MKTSRKVLFAAAAAAVCTATMAQAASLVNFEVLGSTSYSSDGSGYAANVTATPGQTVYYEVVAQIAAAGTTNVDGDYGPFTLGTQTAADGINSVNFNLSSTAGGSLSATVNNASGSNFTQISSYNPGVASGSAVTDIVAGLNPGAFLGGTSQVQVVTGSFVASSSGTLSAAYDTVDNSGAGIKFFDALSSANQSIAANNDTEDMATVQANAANDEPYDPLLGFQSLSISSAVSAVPAPGVVPALALVSGLCVFGGLRRRRRLMA